MRIGLFTCFFGVAVACYWLKKHKCKLWLWPENMGFIITLCLHSHIWFLWCCLHSEVTQRQFMIRHNVMHKPQQRANWRQAKWLHIALQFTLMKWPQQKADLLFFFFWVSKVQWRLTYGCCYIYSMSVRGIQSHKRPTLITRFSPVPLLPFHIKRRPNGQSSVSWSCVPPVIEAARHS